VSVEQASGLARRILRFEAQALLVATLAVALVLGTAPFTAPSAQAAEPKVVIIVGPVGGLTGKFIAVGERAAAEARRHTSDVTTLYSPNATWPAVKAALQGASVVVYLGHGNGFPSRYTTVLRSQTQNGFGLNPVAGVDDVAHQYFGEQYLARDVDLAPDAVVLLHRLCYASGNSEPGLPEGSLEVGQQRVDNFAAGFLAAGASAVVADAYADPAWYMRRLLGGSGTVEAIWRGAPTKHGHVLAFRSQRSPGFTALMDPTEPRSGFYRSLVTKAELRAEEIRRGAALVEAGPAIDPGAPIGPPVSAATIDGVPTVGADVTLALDLVDPGSAPAGLGLGVRWDALAPEPSQELPTGTPSEPPGEAAATEASPSAEATTLPSPASDARTATPEPLLYPDQATPSLDATPPAAEAAPEVSLVAAEVPGAVVKVGTTTKTGTGLAATIAVPDGPGLYRLVVTLHDADGVAFDAATQETIPALVVRVTPALSATIGAPDRLTLHAAETASVPVTILNSGELPWYAPLPEGDPQAVIDRLVQGTWGAQLVGHWISLEVVVDAADVAPVPDVVVDISASPGGIVTADLPITAPSEPGPYLLVLDVVSPIYGSLTNLGAPEPTAIRVEVSPPSDPPPALD
jgi:hypothetical protein